MVFVSEAENARLGQQELLRLEENIRVRHTHTPRPHLEEPLTPHTFIASPIRGEGGEDGRDTERERQKERKKRGGEMYFINVVP